MPNDFLQIKPLLIAALETGINAYLMLDDRLEDYLTPMAGKVLAVHITSLDLTLYLCPGYGRLQLIEHYEGEADATLCGSLSALGLMGFSATPMRSLFKGKVKISGDTLLAQKFQRLFEKLDFKLEAKLARYTGERFAHGLAGVLRGSRDWTEHSLTSFRLNLEEFLQEETRDLPAKAEAEIIFQEIDACRSDVDRIEARIDRLVSAVKNETKSA
ncbi:ubiquinone biosynthesis accessory factor UbiJ [Methylomonas sp. MgM2]